MRKLLSLARRRTVALAVGVVLAVTVASAVAAGNGLGAYVSLGFNNTIGNYSTSITAAAAKNAFQVINTASSAARAIYAESRSTYATIWGVNKGGGTALALTTNNGAPPIRVMNPASGTATNLSADKLDGVDSTGFLRDDLVRVPGTASASNSTGPKSSTATCPAGKYLTGGGGFITAAAADAPVALSASEPNAGLTAWTVTAVEGSDYAAAWSVTAYAICATATP